MIPGIKDHSFYSQEWDQPHNPETEVALSGKETNFGVAAAD